MSGIAIITEACIDVKGHACVDVCPVQCIYEFDSENNVLVLGGPGRRWSDRKQSSAKSGLDRDLSETASCM